MQLQAYYLVKFKITLLGDVQVGKSSILNSLKLNDFDEKYESTIGVDFFVKNFQLNNKTVRLQLWDASGNMRFRPLLPNYIKNSNAVIICYDVTNQQSFQNISQWIRYVKEEEEKDVQIYILGNKSDLEEKRQVSFDAAIAYTQDLKVQFFEVSALSSLNIQEFFLKVATNLCDSNLGQQQNMKQEFMKTAQQIKQEQKQQQQSSSNKSNCTLF